ncbi:hypothetical protein BSKO_07906 [Bryopsis sp. KO-2023]|nr:hypothetical protein BSKO_07906 [Bryopsis sp. KO-2023]
MVFRGRTRPEQLWRNPARPRRRCTPFTKAVTCLLFVSSAIFIINTCRQKLNVILDTQHSTDHLFERILPLEDQRTSHKYGNRKTGFFREQQLGDVEFEEDISTVTMGLGEDRATQTPPDGASHEQSRSRQYGRVDPVQPKHHLGNLRRPRSNPRTSGDLGNLYWGPYGSLTKARQMPTMPGSNVPVMVADTKRFNGAIPGYDELLLRYPNRV